MGGFGTPQAYSTGGGKAPHFAFNQSLSWEGMLLKIYPPFFSTYTLSSASIL